MSPGERRSEDDQDLEEARIALTGAEISTRQLSHALACVMRILARHAQWWHDMGFDDMRTEDRASLKGMLTAWVFGQELSKKNEASARRRAALLVASTAILTAVIGNLPTWIQVFHR